MPDRRISAQIGAHESWARTADRSARTEPARRAAWERFERQVDPDGLLSPAERAKRAEHARKAHYLRMALKSAEARRKARELIAEAEAAEAELSTDAA